MNISDQQEIIMDWIYEEDNEFFSVHDQSFFNYWNVKTNGLKETLMIRRVNELVKLGRLDKQRSYQEKTRSAGVPRWLYIYS